MPTTIQITTDNFDGQTAIITFTPDNGGPVVNIGSQVLPYYYTSDYHFGVYTLYFPKFKVTCDLVILNTTPTPTPTHTITPTITPTMTPTPSPTLPQQRYVYELCNVNVVQYVIQNLPGLTVVPGQVIKSFDDPNNEFMCYKFSGVTTSNLSYIPIGTSVITSTGNYFTNTLNTEFNNCRDCNYVAPLPRCTTVIFTVGGVNPLCNDGLPSQNHAAIEWTDCDGFRQTYTFGGSSPGAQYQVCALTNGNSNISPTQPIPDFICGYGTVTDTGGECVNCYSYTINGPRSLTYLNCSGISTTVNVPAGDSLSICSKYRGASFNGYC